MGSSPQVAARSNPRPATFDLDVELAAPASKAGIGHTPTVAEDASPQPERREGEPRVPPEIRTVSFPSSRRGYDRSAVDAYVERVNRLIAELEANRSPQAAVRHALDRVTEQVGGILQRARETAEEITASAREEAEERTARAKAEVAGLVADARAEAEAARAEAEERLAKARTEADAILVQSRAEADERLQRLEEEIAALREQAEARMRELEADSEAVREERRALLHDMGAMAARLEKMASEAVVRFPPRKSAEVADEELSDPAMTADTEPPEVRSDG
jgi:DivIVA domain-containing protein